MNSKNEFRVRESHDVTFYDIKTGEVILFIPTLIFAEEITNGEANISIRLDERK